MWVISHAEKLEFSWVQWTCLSRKTGLCGRSRSGQASFINVYLKQNVSLHSWFCCSAGEMKLHGLYWVWSNSLSNHPKVDVFRLWEEADISEKTHTDTWRTCRLHIGKPEPRSFLLRLEPQHQHVALPVHSWLQPLKYPEIFAHILPSSPLHIFDIWQVWGRRTIMLLSGKSTI